MPGSKAALQTKAMFVSVYQPRCEAVQLHAALSPANLHAALGKSQLSASKSELCSIQIREQVKEIRGPERYFHDLSIPFTKSITLHGS